MMGVPVESPAFIFGDNQSILANTTMPESTLKKKSNSTAFNFVREGCTRDEWRTTYDLVTKPLPSGKKRDKFVRMVLLHIWSMWWVLDGIWGPSCTSRRLRRMLVYMNLNSYQLAYLLQLFYVFILVRLMFWWNRAQGSLMLICVLNWIWENEFWMSYVSWGFILALLFGPMLGTGVRVMVQFSVLYAIQTGYASEVTSIWLEGSVLSQWAMGLAYLSYLTSAVVRCVLVCIKVVCKLVNQLP